MLKLKRLLITAVLSLFAISLSAQTAKQKTDREIDSLKGKVKSVAIEMYKINKDNQSERIFIGKSMKKYNANGRITEATSYTIVGPNGNMDYEYTNNGVYEQRCVFSYDAKGILTRRDFYNAAGVLKVIWIYSHDAKGNLIKIEKYKDKIIPALCDGKTVWKYDARGNCTEEAEYFFVRDREVYTFSGRKNYKYDTKNFMIEIVNYDAMEKMTSGKTVYKYNAKGSITEELEYDVSGRGKPVLVTTIINKYDDKGNMIQRDAFNKNDKKSPLSRDTFRYDTKGNMIEQISMGSDLVWLAKTTSGYDAMGNIIDYKVFENRNIKNQPPEQVNGETSTYEYYK